MNLKKLLSKGFLSLVLSLLSLSVFAQNAENIDVSGVVTDFFTGEPLVGVSITVKGSNEGAISDVNGAYLIRVTKGKTLVFSYLGYNTREVRVSQSKQDVLIEENAQALSEVVVVGYGTMKRSDLTGAVGSIGAKEIKESVPTSLEQAMQGRIAGVQITQNSGAPGGGISVSIRGINSLNGNEPLYVIEFAGICSILQRTCCYSGMG
jgi:hypothetical protein